MNCLMMFHEWLTLINEGLTDLHLQCQYFMSDQNQAMTDWLISDADAS